MASMQMSLKELAAYLNLHYATAYELAVKGFFPGYRVGALWRFDQDEIDRWRFAEEAKYNKGRRVK